MLFRLPHHHLLVQETGAIQTYDQDGSHAEPLLRQRLAALRKLTYHVIVVTCATIDCRIYRPDSTGRLVEEDIHARARALCHAGASDPRCV
jgi:hypothetical protein